MNVPGVPDILHEDDKPHFVELQVDRNVGNHPVPESGFKPSLIGQVVGIQLIPRNDREETGTILRLDHMKKYVGILQSYHIDERVKTVSFRLSSGIGETAYLHKTSVEVYTYE